MDGEVEVLRGSSLADCAAVRPLVEAHVAFERSAAVLAAGWETTFAEALGAGRVALFVARLDGRVMGYATMTFDFATWTAKSFGHLDCLFVDGAYRGSGVGRKLVAAVVEHALAQGVRELQWQTPSWNEDAIRFYERLGAAAQHKVRFTLALSTARSDQGRC